MDRLRPRDRRRHSVELIHVLHPRLHQHPLHLLELLRAVYVPIYPPHPRQKLLQRQPLPLPTLQLLHVALVHHLQPQDAVVHPHEGELLPALVRTRRTLSPHLLHHLRRPPLYHIQLRLRQLLRYQLTDAHLADPQVRPVRRCHLLQEGAKLVQLLGHLRSSQLEDGGQKLVTERVHPHVVQQPVQDDRVVEQLEHLLEVLHLQLADRQVHQVLVRHVEVNLEGVVLQRLLECLVRRHVRRAQLVLQHQVVPRLESLDELVDALPRPLPNVLTRHLRLQLHTLELRHETIADKSELKQKSRVLFQV
mmetsp:Transcript_11224/g.38226  ORF Transcript_11224/g.38226 Transcript_11224/m.38226 type:complete len:306 (-) Transcript_11224:2591-3508(-)